MDSTIHRHTIDSVVFCFWLSFHLFLISNASRSEVAPGSCMRYLGGVKTGHHMLSQNGDRGGAGRPASGIRITHYDRHVQHLIFYSRAFFLTGRTMGVVTLISFSLHRLAVLLSRSAGSFGCHRRQKWIFSIFNRPTQQLQSAGSHLFMDVCEAIDMGIMYSSADGVSKAGWSFLFSRSLRG